jgi:hypothetical protein
MTSQTSDLQASDTGPEHIFLTAQQVIARYGWGRTKGYRMLRSEGFPRPIGGDRYRLDALMEWERRQQASGVPSKPMAELPPRRRRSTTSRSVAVQAFTNVR